MKNLNIRFIKQNSYNPVEDYHKNRIKSDAKSIKLVSAVIILVIWILYRIFSTFIKIQDLETLCFKDHLQDDVFRPLTMFLSQNLIYRDILLIFSSAILDVTLISFFTIFVLYGNSWKVVLSMVFFYAFRGGFVQNLNLFKFPEMFLFLDPGFFSFAVAYQETPDFFYSGHVGVSFIISYYLRKFGFLRFHYFGCFVTCTQFFTMITLRGHYSIDLVFGLLFAHYFIIISGFLSIYFDKYFNIFGYKDNKDEQNSNKKIEMKLKSITNNN